MFPPQAIAAAVFSSLIASSTATYDATSNANLAMYYGQGPNQQNLQVYCDQSAVDIIPIAFINVFPPSANGLVQENFGNMCWNQGNYTGPGYDGLYTPGDDLLYTRCPYLQQDIYYCQTQTNKKLLLSIGGSEPGSDVAYHLDGAADGVYFAEWLWGAYGPYNASWVAAGGLRPLDRGLYNTDLTQTVDFDGFDFDIEYQSADDQAGYIACIQRLRELFAEHKAKVPDSKDYIISGAPQCPLPDENMSKTIQAAEFDIIWVQFYNNGDNGCTARNWIDDGSKSNFNFDEWVENLAGTASAHAKVYIGLLGSPLAGTDTDYLAPTEAEALIAAYQSYASFGGVMLWEATYAQDNGMYQDSIKSYLTSDAPTTTMTSSFVVSTSSGSSSSDAATSSVGSMFSSTQSSTLLPGTASSSAVLTISSYFSSSTDAVATTSISSVIASTSSRSSSSNPASSSSVSSSNAATSSSVSSSLSYSLNATQSSTSLPGIASSTAGLTSSSYSSSSIDPQAATSTSSVTISTTSRSSSSQLAASLSVSSSFNSTQSSTSLLGTTSSTTVLTNSSSSIDTGATSSTSSTVSLTSVHASSSSLVYSTSTTSSTPTQTSYSNSTVASPQSSSSVLGTGTSSVGILTSSAIEFTSVPASSGTLSGSVSSARGPSFTFSGSASETTSFSSSESDPSSGTTSGTLSTSLITGSSSSASITRYTTSTVYVTSVYTITSCAATVTDCPGRIGKVTTEIISLYTTVCPVTATETGSGSTSSIGSASGVVSNPASSTLPSPNSSIIQYTTSTAYQTSIYKITSCAATVTDCPARLGSVTTEIISLYTTVCPVTPTETGSGSSKTTSAQEVISPPAATGGIHAVSSIHAEGQDTTTNQSLIYASATNFNTVALPAVSLASAASSPTAPASAESASSSTASIPASESPNTVVSTAPVVPIQTAPYPTTSDKASSSGVAIIPIPSGTSSAASGNYLPPGSLLGSAPFFSSSLTQNLQETSSSTAAASAQGSIFVTSTAAAAPSLSTSSSVQFTGAAASSLRLRGSSVGAFLAGGIAIAITMIIALMV